MKTASVKTNYLLNLINTGSGLLFPLITFPYASRILMADGIGTFQFFDTTVGYILLITSLGIPLYAVRAVARVRHDARERNRTAVEILLLHAFLTLFAYAAVLAIACTVSRIRVNIPLFMIVSSSLLFTAVGAQWFYQAIEDFKYITLRSLFMKVLSAAGLFLLVKNQSDLLWYAVVNTGASVGNNLFNFIRLRKYISVRELRWKEIRPLRHLKASLHVFPLNLITSVYTVLDTQMLGYLSSDAAIGYYTAATKLTKMSLGIVTALGGVLLPRFSHLLSNGHRDEFIDLGNKSISFTAALTLPMTAGLILLSRPIIAVFSGPDYVPAGPALQIIAPITIFIGFSSLLGLQVLYPQGKVNKIILAAGTGASVNILLNFLLIPRYAHIGAATATLAAEFSVTLMVFILGYKHFPFKFITRQNINYLAGTLLMSLAVLLLLRWKTEPWKLLAAGVPLGIAVYSGYLALCRDPLLRQAGRFLTGRTKER